jgi:chromosome segregation ATPase
MRFSFVCFALLAGALAATTAVPVKSVLKSPSVPAKVVPTQSQSKVENYVSVLKKDLDAQEATLRGFVSKAERDRRSRQKQLVTLTAVMNHLHEQLLNTTKYYHEYNQNVGNVQSKLKPLTLEYDRANALYTQTKGKLKEEREFLDTLLAYIKARKERC